MDQRNFCNPWISVKVPKVTFIIANISQMISKFSKLLNPSVPENSNISAWAFRKSETKKIHIIPIFINV